MVHYAPKKTCSNTSIINHLGIKDIKGIRSPPLPTNEFLTFDILLHIKGTKRDTKMVIYREITKCYFAFKKNVLVLSLFFLSCSGEKKKKYKMIIQDYY